MVNEDYNSACNLTLLYSPVNSVNQLIIYNTIHSELKYIKQIPGFDLFSNNP